jgi:mannose-6-phosphate isomerase-like protein (cupin superfamily)
VSAFPIGTDGSAVTLLWGRDGSPTFPDDGQPRPMAAGFPTPGGSAVAIMSIAPEGNDFHEFVADALTPWSDPDDPGMHRTATIDYDVVLEGVIGLELDDGVEVTLNPGDLVVQNGTRHRWHNRGTTVARMLSVTVGAYNRFEGGRAV